MNKQGSAHVTIVIILALALVTALGWIFYQNFIHKEEPVKDTELVVVDESKGELEDKEGANADEPTESYLSFDEWGVRVPLNSKQASEFSAAQSSEKNESYIVSSTKIKTGCKDKSYARSFGTVSRFVADKKTPKNGLWDGKSAREMYGDAATAVVVDKYLYHFESPQGSCVDPTSKIGKELQATEPSVSKNFLTALKKLEASN